MQFKKTYLLIILCQLSLTQVNVFSQKDKSQTDVIHQNIELETIPLKINNWDFKPEAVEFLEYKSRAAMKLITGDLTVAKDIVFTNGIIEYDIELIDPRFTSCHFRWKDKNESEIFYFRTKRADSPYAIDAIQYAPQIAGVNMWNMYPQYQSNANFKLNDWNHVKLIVSGKQLRVYINDMLKPALVVPILEGNVSSGALAFNGKAIISNLVIKHNEVEGLCPNAGTDLTVNDTRFISKWELSQPVSTIKGIDFSTEYAPNDKTTWSEISSENYGLINLTRRFGKTGGRNIVWLKATVNSDKIQEKNLRLGFNDEVWVIINDKPLYMDKNPYNTPMMKHPHGRCSIENSGIKIPLKEGDNQLLIGVANYFYGWGIIARFDDIDGINFER